MAKEIEEDLKSNGIISISQFSNNHEFQIIKAELGNEQTMNKLINEGLFIGYKKLKVEKYIQPVKIIQCYNCQKFGHFASNCKVKETTCAKCSGEHRVKECKVTILKCANCGNEHTSSYGGCPFKQNKLKEKIEQINTKTTTFLRSYSSTVNGELNKMSNIEVEIKNFGNKIDKLDEKTTELIKNLEIRLSNLIDNKIIAIVNKKITECNEMTENKIKATHDKIVQVTQKINDTQNSVKNQINKAFEDLKTQQVTFQIDIFRGFWPKTNYQTHKLNLL